MRGLYNYNATRAAAEALHLRLAPPSALVMATRVEEEAKEAHGGSASVSTAGDDLSPSHSLSRHSVSMSSAGLSTVESVFDGSDASATVSNMLLAWSYSWLPRVLAQRFEPSLFVQTVSPHSNRSRVSAASDDMSLPSPSRSGMVSEPTASLTAPGIHVPSLDSVGGGGGGSGEGGGRAPSPAGLPLMDYARSHAREQSLEVAPYMFETRESSFYIPRALDVAHMAAQYTASVLAQAAHNTWLRGGADAELGAELLPASTPSPSVHDGALTTGGGASTTPAAAAAAAPAPSVHSAAAVDDGFGVTSSPTLLQASAGLPSLRAPTVSTLPHPGGEAATQPWDDEPTPDEVADSVGYMFSWPSFEFLGTPKPFAHGRYSGGSADDLGLPHYPAGALAAELSAGGALSTARGPGAVGAGSTYLLGPAANAKHVDINVDYEMQSIIGDGGYACVRRAVRRSTGQPCVVKMIRKRFLLTEEEKDSVMREVEVHRLLRHPNIVQLWDAYEDAKDYVYLVLERVPGGDLAAYIRNKCVRHFSETQTRVVMDQLLAAVEYMHNMGILHADIKPSNILLDDCQFVPTSNAPVPSAADPREPKPVK
ncbi:hypothetical protein EON68_01505, partial [archaeon]